MKRFLLFLLMAAAAACATPDRSEPTSELSMDVTVTDEGNGTFLVDFAFASPQRYVVFYQSVEPYRTPDWSSLTRGASVDEIGGFDVLVFERPARRASFRIKPYAGDLTKAYTPFLQFTDGNWGILPGQFRAWAATDRAMVEATSVGASDWPGEELEDRVTIVTPRPVIYEAKKMTSPLTLTPEIDGRYIYIGDGVIREGTNFIGILDPGLPPWIERGLDADLNRIFGELSREFGFDLDQKAEILFAFEGLDHPGLSQTGGAIGNQLALEISGDALSEPDDSIADFFRWFLTHEAAHLFQSAGGMKSNTDTHAWIHEGAANTMAHRIGARLASDPNAFLAEVYGQAFTTCVDYLEEGKTLPDAILTGRFDAHYACGDFFALITEAELDRGDIFDFWRAFLVRAREETGGAISPALYASVAIELGVSEETVGVIESFVYAPVENPRSSLTQALTVAGLEPRFNAAGELIGLELPR